MGQLGLPESPLVAIWKTLGPSTIFRPIKFISEERMDLGSLPISAQKDYLTFIAQAYNKQVL